MIAEQKAQVRVAIESGKTIPQVQRLLGLKHCSQIRTWLKREEPELHAKALENATTRQHAQKIWLNNVKKSDCE